MGKELQVGIGVRRKAGDINPDVQVLPTAKQGRPFLLGEKLDGHTQAYIRAGGVCDAGGVITTDTVLQLEKLLFGNLTLFYLMKRMVLL